MSLGWRARARAEAHLELEAHQAVGGRQPVRVIRVALQVLLCSRNDDVEIELLAREWQHMAPLCQRHNRTTCARTRDTHASLPGAVSHFLNVLHVEGQPQLLERGHQRLGCA